MEFRARPKPYYLHKTRRLVCAHSNMTGALIDFRITKSPVNAMSRKPGRKWNSLHALNLITFIEHDEQRPPTLLPY